MEVAVAAVAAAVGMVRVVVVMVVAGVGGVAAAWQRRWRRRLWRQQQQGDVGAGSCGRRFLEEAVSHATISVVSGLRTQGYILHHVSFAYAIYVRKDIQADLAHYRGGQQHLIWAGSCLVCLLY